MRLRSCFVVPSEESNKVCLLELERYDLRGGRFLIALTRVAHIEHARQTPFTYSNICIGYLEVTRC